MGMGVHGERSVTANAPRSSAGGRQRAERNHHFIFIASVYVPAVRPTRRTSWCSQWDIAPGGLTYTDLVPYRGPHSVRAESLAKAGEGIDSGEAE
jgi:hypothetical protein